MIDDSRNYMGEGMKRLVYAITKNEENKFSHEGKMHR